MGEWRGAHSPRTRQRQSVCGVAHDARDFSQLDVSFMCLMQRNCYYVGTGRTFAHQTDFHFDKNGKLFIIVDIVGATIKLWWIFLCLSCLGRARRAFVLRQIVAFPFRFPLEIENSG